jgi:hypothetical protein
MVITFLTSRIQLETYRKIGSLVSLSLDNTEIEKMKSTPIYGFFFSSLSLYLSHLVQD